MVAVRLDPYQNIVNVGWSKGQIGHLEVWMDLRTPYYATNNPTGQPNSPAQSHIEARIVVPSRTDYVRQDSPTKGTDPNNEDLYPEWDWVEHQTSGDPNDGTDSILPMPTQAVVDDHIMTQAGMHRIYPIGVTGGNVSAMTIGGASNFLLNWTEIAKAEFFGLPADTPRSEWPPLRVELYGSVEGRDGGGRTYTAHIQFRLLSTGDVADLTRVDPDDWLEISYPTETVVIEESVRVERSYFKNFYVVGATFNSIEQARQHIGTLVYNWAPGTDEDAAVIEEP